MIAHGLRDIWVNPVGKRAKGLRISLWISLITPVECPRRENGRIGRLSCYEPGSVGRSIPQALPAGVAAADQAEDLEGNKKSSLQCLHHQEYTNM